MVRRSWRGSSPCESLHCAHATHKTARCLALEATCWTGVCRWSPATQLWFAGLAPPNLLFPNVAPFQNMS